MDQETGNRSSQMEDLEVLRLHQPEVFLRMVSKLGLKGPDPSRPLLETPANELIYPEKHILEPEAGYVRQSQPRAGEILANGSGEVYMLTKQFDAAFATYESTGGTYAREDIKALMEDRLVNMTPEEAQWIANEGTVDMVIFPELQDIETPEAAAEVVRRRAEQLQTRLPLYRDVDLEPQIAEDLADARVEDIVGCGRNNPLIAFVGRNSHIKYGGTTEQQIRRVEASDVNMFSLSPDENLIRYLRIATNPEHPRDRDNALSSILAYDNGSCSARNFQMMPINGSVLHSGIDFHNNGYRAFVGWSDANEIYGKTIGAIE